MPDLQKLWETATPIKMDLQAEWDAAQPIEKPTPIQTKPVDSDEPLYSELGLPVGKPEHALKAVDAAFLPLRTALNTSLISPEDPTTLADQFEQKGMSLSDVVGGASRGLLQQGAATEARPFNITDKEDFGNIAETGGRLALELGTMGPYARGVGKLAGAAAGGLGKLKAPKLLTPKTDISKAEKAIGQILQGKTKDMPKGLEAIAATKTDSVKTYSDLSNKIKESIAEHGKLVDAELLKDTTLYKLDDLSTIQKTKGGQEIVSNHVNEALENLKELYTKIKDPVKAGEIDELLSKAATEGLTKKDVNDIARLYGSEYKAFSPSTGEPLTSVNKQAYENTRKGLKEVARRGLGGTAKDLDHTLSSLLNTRRLIEKNVEAVNRLRQKIDKRGLGEKAGRALYNIVDHLTLGTVKGFLLKAFPRGLGYKTKNYIDLEESLRRNLKTVNSISEKVAGKGKIVSKTVSKTAGVSFAEIAEIEAKKPTLTSPKEQAALKEFGDFFDEMAGEKMAKLKKAEPPPKPKIVKPGEYKAPKGKEPWKNSDLAKKPNLPIDRTQAQKQPGGKWKLLYRGTRNEVFAGEEFNSAYEAKQFFKVQQVKAQAELKKP